LKNINVLQISKLSLPAIGGIERVVQQIAEGLNDRTNMKVLVCQRKGKGSVENINDVEIHKASSWGVALSMPLSFNFFQRFNKLKKDRDILHIHLPFPLADVALCLFGFEGKVVLWWHSDVVRQKRLLLFYKPFLMRLLKRADLITVATEGHITGSDYLPAFRDKCVIIPYGLNDKILQKADLYQPLDKDVSMPVQFLFVGRLAYYKGVDVLLNAFSTVTGAELVIVGDGPLEAQLKSQAKQLKIENNVRFAHGVKDDELPRYYAKCDVFVLPSVMKSEAFGLVQLEAMAFGKPVINTSLPGGVPYVSINARTGLTVPPSDVSALVNAMQKLVNDPTLRKQYGKAAHKRVRDAFSTKVMMNRLLEQYRKLLAGT